jgi:phosphohistidine phosphatase
MKALYLMRHAKSGWKKPASDDHRRPLNKRGKHDVPVMANRLNSRSIHLDRIVSSDARRALDTALPVGTVLGLDDDAIQPAPFLYNATQEQILDIARNFKDEWQQVMIVGHNPGIQDLANRFYAPPIAKFPAAGIVSLVFEIDTWRDIDPKRLIYTDFDFPKNNRRTQRQERQNR